MDKPETNEKERLQKIDLTTSQLQFEALQLESTLSQLESTLSQLKQLNRDNAYAIRRNRLAISEILSAANEGRALSRLESMAPLTVAAPRKERTGTIGKRLAGPAQARQPEPLAP